MNATEVSTMATEGTGIPQRLRQLRIAKGLTQQQLATAAGLSMSIVSQIEQGLNPDPKASTLQKLARPLGVSPGELFGDESVEEQAPPPKPPRKRK